MTILCSIVGVALALLGLAIVAGTVTDEAWQIIARWRAERRLREITKVDLKRDWRSPK